MPNTSYFYRVNMPRGTAFIMTESWATGATPHILIAPEANEEIFIEEIGIQCSLGFTMPAGKNIVFTGLNESDGTTAFEVHTIEELMALLNDLYIDATVIVGKLKPKPPLKLTDSGGETLNIEHTDGDVGVITAGTITFIIKGWRLAEADD